MPRAAQPPDLPVDDDDDIFDDDGTDQPEQPAAEQSIAPSRPPRRRNHIPLHPEMERLLLDAAREGATDGMLCGLLGMNGTAIHHWRKLAKTGEKKHKEYKKIIQRIEQARLEGDLALLKNINKASASDWRAGQFRLGCRHVEFSERRLAAREAAEAAESARIREAEAAAAAANASGELSILDPEVLLELQELAKVALARVAAKRKGTPPPT